MTRKKKVKPKDARELYMIEICQWKTDYSVGSDPHRTFKEGPYCETHLIQITGVFLEPPKVAGRTVRLGLKADRHMTLGLMDCKPGDKAPNSVGWLTSRGSYSVYWGSLPHDVFPTVMLMLSAGKYRYVQLNGLALRYGEAPVYHCSFMEEREE